MADIVICDLDAGNLHSVRRAVARVAPERAVSVTASPEKIAAAAYLILPGQSALTAWMKKLDGDENLRAALMARLQNGPVLGICLGLQALYQSSEEYRGDGLGLLAGRVRRFATAPKIPPVKIPPIKVPHMGWNRVRQTRAHPLWNGIADNEYFYFAHSFHIADARAEEVAGESEYGEIFTAAAARDNLFAVQFHPEKSQRAGLQLLRNFVNWHCE